MCWAKIVDWEEAHSIAQEVHDSEGYWVHAFYTELRRFGECGVLVRESGKPVKAREDLNEEWDQMAGFAFL